MSRKLKIPKEEYQKVIDIYLSGKSIPETANYFNVSDGLIFYILKKCNIQRRSVKEGNSLKWKNNDFKNNQIEKRTGKSSGALGKKWKLKHIKKCPTNTEENNHFWKGGKTKISQQIRNSVEYRIWRIEVFKRDWYTCQICGAKNKKGKKYIFDADHIYPLYKIIDDFEIKSYEDAISCEKLWDIDNGRCLCRKCHKKTESWGTNQYKEKN